MGFSSSNRTNDKSKAISVKAESIIQLISSFLSLGFQIGVLVGAACLLLYCWRINYFPSGVTIGESISLLIIFIGFSAFLFSFAIPLTFLGLKLRPLWISIEKIILFLLKFLLKKEQKNYISYEKTGKLDWLLALPGALIVFMFIRENPINLIFFLEVLWLLALFWSAIRQQMQEISVLTRTAKSSIDYPDLEKDLHHLKRQRDRVVKLCLIAVFIPVLVFSFTDVPGQFLDRSFEVLGLRQEKIDLYIRPPYSTVIINSGVDYENIASSSKEIKIKNARVLLSNIGGKVVADLPRKNEKARFKIPREYVLEGG